MKIEVEAPFERPRAPAAGQAASSFGALMDPWGSSPDHAAGFGALGMFGRSRATREAPRETAPRQPTRTAPERSAGAGHPTSAPSARDVTGTHATFPGLWTDPPVFQPQRVRVSPPKATPDPNVLLEAVAAASAEAAQPDPVEKSTAADSIHGRMTALRERPQREGRAPGVTLMQDAAGTVVVISGFRMASDVLEHFRASARTILARQGMTLYKLIVNGADHSADPQSKGITPWR